MYSTTYKLGVFLLFISFIIPCVYYIYKRKHKYPSFYIKIFTILFCIGSFIAAAKLTSI